MDYVTVPCTCLTIIAIINILHLTAFASEDSTSIDSIKIESSVYYIEKDKQTIVHISGNLTDKSRQKITIIITAPDSSQEFILITSTDNGYFETPYLLDFTLQIGTYDILARTTGGPIGHIEFEVKKRMIVANSSNDVVTEKQHPSIPNKSILMIETDRLAYNTGDSISISGKISNPHLDLLVDQPIIIRILSSNNNIIFIDQINIDEFGTFSTSLIISGSMWSTKDTYIIMAHYGKNIGTSNFTFSPSILHPSQNQIHAIATLELVVNNKPFDFSRTEYQLHGNNIQFEGKSNTIYRYNSNANIGHLFKSLGMEITDSCVNTRSDIKFCKDTMHDLVFKINGNTVNRIHNYIPKNGDKITILYEDISTEEKLISTMPNNNIPNNISPISPTQPIVSIAPNITGSIPAPSRSDSTIPVILLILVILIVLFIIIFKGKHRRGVPSIGLFKKNRSRRMMTSQSSGEASTIAFYECPKCHDSDIRNNSDGSATCDNCGFTT